MADVTLRSVGPISDYSGAATTPTKGTGPVYVTVDVAIFYNDSANATLSGFTQLNRVDTGTGVVVMVTLGRAFADATTIANSYTPTITGGGGDARSQVQIWENVDPSSPVPSGGATAAAVDGAATLNVPGGTVARAGSRAKVSGASWDFGVWNSVTPSGLTNNQPSEGVELGTYYTTSTQSVGTSIGANFGTQSRCAVCLTVLQPAAAATPSGEPLLMGNPTLVF